jgi:hypothetical protein
MIGKTIATQVTSVLQTTAGKMIFGRFPEEAEMSAAAGAGPSGSRQQDRRQNERPVTNDHPIEDDRFKGR